METHELLAGTNIEAGTKVLVTDFFGGEHVMTAQSGVEIEGHAFPIIWVEDDLGRRVPWPAEAVTVGT